MRERLKCALLAAALMAPSTSIGQSPRAVAVPDQEKIIKAAREVMHKARYCALITIGENGQPQARTMDPFPPEANMTVWMATNPASRKVAQIRKDSRVTLYYFDPDDPGYVTLFGRAEVVQDPVEKAKHWKEDWTDFYRDRNHGEDYLLIRVKAGRLEVVSHEHGLAGDAQTWQPAGLELR